MKKTAAVILLGLLLSLTSCASKTPADSESTADISAETTTQKIVETTAETIEETGPKLLFEDNFDGEDIDYTKWERCPEWERQGGADIWSNALSYTDGEGHLILRAQWNDTDKRVESGAVRTNGLFTCAEGYYEASIRFPIAPGTWGAFWMMCGDVAGVDGTSKDGIEIDIIESISNEAGASNHAMHWDGYGDDTKSEAMTLDRKIYDGEYHLFALEWTEQEYIFYVDDEETWRTSAGGMCAAEGYLKLTVEAAAWAGSGTDASISSLPADMEVDYVRVWSQRP